MISEGDSLQELERERDCTVEWDKRESDMRVIQMKKEKNGEERGSTCD